MTDKPKTVRVRVAVAINQDGHYGASGCCCHENDSDAFEDIIGIEGPYVSELFIAADVPLPAPPAEIPGEVEDAK